MYLFIMIEIAAARKLNSMPSIEWKYKALNQKVVHISQVNGLTFNRHVKLRTRITPIEANPKISINSIGISAII